MASQVSISNQALSLLGANLITALSDTSTEANLCNANYDDTRDAVLRAHPWSCATYRASLARLTDTPTFGFKYTYALPNDPYCLTVIETDTRSPYRIEGRTLLSDEGAVKVRYIGRVTDPGQFDPNLVEAIATRLAAKMAYALTQNHTLTTNMYSLAEALVYEAATADGLEVGREEIHSDGFSAARA